MVMKNNLPLFTQYFDLTFFTVSGYGKLRTLISDLNYFPAAAGVLRKVSIVLPKP